MTATPANTVPTGPNFRRILWLDIALPFVAVFALERFGVAPLAAYAAASLFPLGSILGSWRAGRGVDVIGLGVVIGIASGLTLGLVTADPRFALLRAAPGFALFGIACLASLPTARPLMFFVARSFAAGGDPALRAAWNHRLVYPRFRRVMRMVTAVWGAGTLFHAGLAVTIAFTLPAQIALIAEPGVAFAIIAALLAWTRGVQRRAPAIEPIAIGA
jgi:hypothetical protein